MVLSTGLPNSGVLDGDTTARDTSPADADSLASATARAARDRKPAEADGGSGVGLSPPSLASLPAPPLPPAAPMSLVVVGPITPTPSVAACARAKSSYAARRTAPAAFDMMPGVMMRPRP